MKGNRGALALTLCAAVLVAAPPIRAADSSVGQSWTVRLKDGRNIGLYECGDPSGDLTIFYFHGLPSCRLEAAFLDAPGQEEGVRIIGVDRPGLGLSDFVDREILDWPADFAQVVEILAREPHYFRNPKNHLKKYGIFALSSGAPFAAACALASQDIHSGPVVQLSSVSIVNGVGPPEAEDNGHASAAFARATRRPYLSALALNLANRSMSRRPDQAMLRYTSEMAREDVEFFASGTNRNRFIAAFQEAMRYGPQGILSEAQLLNRSWGFSVYGRGQNVRFYYGANDLTTPPTIAAFLQREGVPASRVTIIPDHGHVSLLDWDNPSNRPLKTVLDTMKRDAESFHARAAGGPSRN